jgi:hypothetical protein
MLLVEPAGPFQFIDVAVGDHVVRATCTDATGLSPGQTIILGANLEAVRLFSADSGARINQNFMETESRIHA